MSVNYIEGKRPCPEGRFGIVVSRFNSFITERLLEGALDTLKRDGEVKDDNITVIRVPGALEIPLTVKKAAASGRFDAILALGLVERGATYHFEIVANESAKGIALVSLESGVPVANGILTTDTLEQAIQRAGSKAGNKGSEAASSALEMVNVLKELA